MVSAGDEGGLLIVDFEPAEFAELDVAMER
jgi:hypothetical protein